MEEELEVVERSLAEQIVVGEGAGSCSAAVGRLVAAAAAAAVVVLPAGSAVGRDHEECGDVEAESVSV